MKFTRLLILATSVLALFISACSQPAAVATPGLEPQFGTKADDKGTDVEISVRGTVYVLSQEGGEDIDTYNRSPELYLKRFDRNSKLLWSKLVSRSGGCEEGYFRSFFERSGIQTDSAGNVYASYVTDLCENGTLVVKKYSPSGRTLKNYRAPLAADPYVDVTNDTKGNIYFSTSGDVSKISINGRNTLFKNPLLAGSLDSVAVSGSSVYTAGDERAGLQKVIRYTTAGKPVWSKTFPLKKSGLRYEIVALNRAVYIRNANTILKLDTGGEQLWTKTQGNLKGINVTSMTTDRSGNLYLAGKYTASSGNRDAFARKLTPRGKVLWTKTFGTSAYDDAKGIATVTGAGIYVTGETQGALAGKNLGGSDGYLRKLNSSGNPLWTR